jgi:stage II sporulation protein D
MIFSSSWRKQCLFAICIAAALAVRAQSPAVKPDSTLRVGLWTLWHDKAVTVSSVAEGLATLRSCESCPPIPLTNSTLIRADGDSLFYSGHSSAKTILLTGPVILAAHGENLTLRNPVRITARNNELVLAVTLPIESYVERVVASESGSADTAESLKALAIVVRSFALHQKHNHADYDLCDSTHCQLLHWGGNPSRSSAAHAATLATAGETLWYHGQRAQAWFHQNCGGRTASPSEVWPSRGSLQKPMPWLVSRTDSYCTAEGARLWSANLSIADLTAVLATAGLVRPGWKSLRVGRRGESGRAVTVLADSTEISAEEFRMAVGRALGWNKILSTWFEVTRQGDEFFFHGRGSGHGVGLCQAGSAAMAAQGREVSEILAQYFPGAEADDEATGKSWQSFRGAGFVLESLDPTDVVYLAEAGRALGEAENISGIVSTGINPAGHITVRAFPSTPAFRAATLAPGWVAAFTEGNWIATQPLSTLAGRKLLVATLRHEFLHVLVESQATERTPLWLREGLAEAWSDAAGISPGLKSRKPSMSLAEIDQGLAHAGTEAQSEAAHRAAGWYAAQLLARNGRAQTLGWLRSGVPAGVLANLHP